MKKLNITQFESLLSAITYSYCTDKDLFCSLSTINLNFKKWPNFKCKQIIIDFSEIAKNTSFEVAYYNISEKYDNLSGLKFDDHAFDDLKVIEQLILFNIKIYWYKSLAQELLNDPENHEAILLKMNNLDLDSNDDEFTVLNHLAATMEANEKRIKEGKNLIVIPDFKLFSEAIGGFNPQRISLISAKSGFGKCLAKGTKVLCFDGKIKNVEDLKIGEMLMGPDSKPRTIVSLGHGFSEMYKIKLNNGDSFSCNDEHILSLTEAGTERYCEIPVKDYLKLNNTAKRKLKSWKTGVEFKKYDNDIDLYFAGIWLGDGSISRPEITTSEKEIKDFVNKYAKYLGLVVRTYKGKGCEQLLLTKGYHNNTKTNIQKMLCKFVVNGKKTIPFELLTSSKEQRLELLAGIVDTDGYVFKNTIEISTKFDTLRDDIAFLCRSLGFRVSQTTKNIKGTNYFLLFISGDTCCIPCKVERKKPAPRKQIKRSNVYGFDVQSLGRGEYFGFELDGDGLFLLSDFTVTHNTKLAINLSDSARKIMPVYYFNMEMSPEDFTAQFIQKNGSITYNDFISGKFHNYQDSFERILKYKDELKSSYEITFTDGRAMNIDKICSRILNKFKERGGIFIIDYDGKMIENSKQDEWLMVLKAIEKLEDVAKATNSHGIVLMQADDSGDAKTSKRAKQPASSMTSFEQDEKGQYVLRNIKNRFGKTGFQIYMDYAADKTQLRELRIKEDFEKTPENILKRR